MEGYRVKPALPFRLPRLFVFFMVLIVLFTLLNVAILFFGKNLFLWFQAIWSWALILLVALMGAMLIGMFISYRVLAMREFTPFEREMMEMRLEVSDMKDSLAEIRSRIGADNPGTEDASDEGETEAEEEG
jgi:type VI protein secretion system component VasK